jgi:WD40 repeat protein
MHNFPYVRVIVLAFFSQTVPSIAQTQNHTLKFDKEIGVGWRTGEYRGWMSFVAFSADGTMVASDGPAAADDVSGDLTLWSFPDGRLIKRLPAQPTAISHDWKYYATYHSVAEVETGRPVISLGKGVYAIHTFSPDSRYVAESIAGGHDLGKIHLVELATGKQVNAFGRSAPSSMAISPDGLTLAAGYWDVIILWDMLTGKKLGAMSGAGHNVAGLSFSRDGKLIAAGTGAGELQIWDVSLSSKVASIDTGLGAGVSQPAFSPDGRLVAFGVYGTGTAWLVDVPRGKIIDHQKVSDLGCGSVAFSPNGRFLVTPSTGGLIKWPYDKGGTIRVFTVTP